MTLSIISSGCSISSSYSPMLEPEQSSTFLSWNLLCLHLSLSQAALIVVVSVTSLSPPSSSEHREGKLVLKESFRQRTSISLSRTVLVSPPSFTTWHRAWCFALYFSFLHFSTKMSASLSDLH